MTIDADVPASAPESTPEQRLASLFGSSENESKPVAATHDDISVSEVDAPPAADESALQEADQAAEDQASDDAPPEGFVELEHLGRKYFVPPDLKTAFEANRAQATRATMELAPVRKALEVEKLALQAAKAADGELKELAAQKAQLESYKEQARKVDWSQLTLDQKVDLDRELRLVNEQLAQVDSQMSAKRSEAERKFGELVVSAVQETERYMAAKVPGWDVEKGKSLHGYGLELGIPAEKLTAGWFADPVATHVMWKAQQWDALQRSKPAVANKASVAPPVVKPGSSAVQKSTTQVAYQKNREALKKSGSLTDAARVLLGRIK